MTTPMTPERLAEIVDIAKSCDDTMRQVVEDLVAELIRVGEQRDEALELLRTVHESARRMATVNVNCGCMSSGLLVAALATVKRG